MWKQINNFPDYFVHEDGRVKSVKTRTNTRKKTRTVVEKELAVFYIKGYAAVNLVSKGKRKSARVHRLVAETFIPRVGGKEHVNHIDGNKENNCIHNLEWCTPSENERHSYDILGKKSNGGLRRRLSDKDVSDVFKRLENGERNKDIAADYNVDPSIISKLKTGATYA